MPIKNISTCAWYLMLSVVVIVPAANDIFISAFPQISQALHTAHPQLILSVFLVGLALSQCFYGPLSDRFGRRPILIAGLILYTLASAQVMLAPTFTWLLIGRFIQAVGACSVVVTTLAVVRDTNDDKHLIAKYTAVVMAIIGISPAIAPLIGSYATDWFGWRASFVILFLLGLFFLMTTLLNHRETIRERNVQALHFKKIFSNYAELLRHCAIRRYSLISALSYGVLFSYVGIASRYYIVQLNLSLVSFGYVIVANALVIFAMALLTPHISRRLGFDKTLFVGAAFICLGGLVMWVSTGVFAANLWSILLSYLICCVGIGMIRPTSSAGVMHSAPHRVAGSAAALFSFLSFIGGALATVVVSALCQHPYEFGIFAVILGIFALGLTTLLLLPKAQCANINGSKN